MLISFITLLFYLVHLRTTSRYIYTYHRYKPNSKGNQHNNMQASSQQISKIPLKISGPPNRTLEMVWLNSYLCSKHPLKLIKIGLCQGKGWCILWGIRHLTGEPWGYLWAVVPESWCVTPPSLPTLFSTGKKICKKVREESVVASTSPFIWILRDWVFRT